MSEKGYPVIHVAIAISCTAGLLWAFQSTRPVDAQQPPAPSEVLAYPDMILYGGQVLTADRDDENFTVAEAVAVRDGEFLAIGSSDEIRRLAGPATRQVDLRGGSVLPGFMDTHQHLHTYATRWLAPEEREPSLRFESLESGLEELKAMADAKPAGEWIVTSTRPYSARAMDRYQIDTVAPRNPVSVEISSEEFILNSLALEKLLELVASDTDGLVTDPKTGKPTGHLRNVAAGVVRYELLPYPSVPIPEYKEILKKEMALESSWGITSVTTRITADALSALNALHQEDELPMRWRVALPFPHLNPRAEAYFSRLGNMDRLGDDMLRINGISFFSIDSAIGRGGAWTHEPKRQLLPGDRSGKHGVSREVNLPLVPLANQYGWSVKSIHSAGDRANTELLRAYQKASNSGGSIVDRRFGIDHGPMLRPEHVKMMAELGVIPSMQAKYVFDDPAALIHQYGRESLHRMTPVRSLIAAGIKPAGGADTGSEPTGHPLWNMEKLVTRTDEKGRVWGAKERIDRKTSLLMYTRWAARYTHDEDRLGSIEPGKLADFVVLGDNLLTAPENVISDLPVRMTVVGGEIIYDRERDGVIRAPGGRLTEG